jgi:ankyrin repeat protein
MLLKRKSIKGILFIVFLYLFTLNLNAQTEEIDTSGYIPFFYDGSLDYNLLIAASKGYDNEVNRLISKGADVFYETLEGATALIYAIANGHLSTVKTLISNSADVNHITLSSETPLLVAVKNQNVEISEALIRSGAHIDFQDNNGATALHFAAIYDISM